MTSSRFETYTFVELSRLNLKRGGRGGTPPLISGFLLPRRGGGFSRGGEGFQTGGVCVFDDGLTRLIRLELLVIGDLNPCKIGGET